MHTPIIHITHNDADAVGCALVATLFYKEGYFGTETHFCSANHGADRKVEELLKSWEDGLSWPPNTLLITDISITSETAEKLERASEEYGFNILSVDHHPTNPNRDKSWMRFVTEDTFGPHKVKEPVSAAYGLWKILFEEQGKFLDPAAKEPITTSFSKFYELMGDDLYELVEKYEKDASDLFIYKLVRRISRYDTWAWMKQPNSYMMEDVVATATKAYGPDLVYKILYNYYTNEFDEKIEKYVDCDGEFDDYGNDICYPIKLRECYSVMTNLEDRYTSQEYIESKVRTYVDGEYQFATYISDNEHANAIATAIYNKYKEIDIVMILYPATRTISLRSNKSTVDLGRFAKRIYGGGGHAQASGAVVSPETMFDFLQKYYNAESVASLSSEN